MSPVVRGVIVADLRHFIDNDGRLTDDGELAAWSVLASLSPGRDVRLQLGACKWTTERFREQLAGLLADAGHVVVEGSRPSTVDALVALLDASGRGRAA